MEWSTARHENIIQLRQNESLILDIQHPHNWQLFFWTQLVQINMSAWLNKMGNRFLITAWAQIVIFFMILLTKQISIIINIIIINIIRSIIFFLFFKLYLDIIIKPNNLINLAFCFDVNRRCQCVKTQLYFVFGKKKQRHQFFQPL